MTNDLSDILELEDKEQYLEALMKFRTLYNSYPDDFEIWKHYYFFLWYVNVEDSFLNLREFVVEHKLGEELILVANEGIKRHSKNAEGLFILGYTIGIMPYYFGDYEEWELKAKSMLFSTVNLEPNNKIYYMVKLGQELGDIDNIDYKNACKDASEDVLKKFNGKGLLNSYFREVLYRIDKIH